MIKILKDPHRLLDPSEVAGALPVATKGEYVAARTAWERAKLEGTDLLIWVRDAAYQNSFIDLEAVHPVELVTPRAALHRVLGHPLPPRLTDEQILTEGLIAKARAGEWIVAEGEVDMTQGFQLGNGKVLGGESGGRPVRSDGPHVRNFFARQRESMGEKAAETLVQKGVEVVGHFPDPEGGPASCQGLFFGRIQSGKTGNLISTIAVAADNGYRCFVVLTSDNIWLYGQTLARVKSALPGLPVFGKDDASARQSTIKTALQRKGVVLVWTKNGTQLKKLLDLLDAVGASQVPAVIVDDEADQASLNTRARRPDEEPSEINRRISELREIFETKAFLQVTATPQALFLQGVDHPYHPDFTVLGEPGNGYVGGETFFGSLEENPYLQFVSSEEIDDLLDENGAATVSEGLRRSLCTFWVAAAAKRLDEPSASFSYLCHVSLKQDDHERLSRMIEGFQLKMADALGGARGREAEAEALGWLQEAYVNLLATSPALPPFEVVMEELSFALDSTSVQVLNAGAAQQQPDYSASFNILVGGAKLGRGVTIERLLVTYYGRMTKSPQMDTVLQHARMYGYRKKDLPLTRVFLPEELARRFQLIFESETALREVIEEFPDQGYEAVLIGENLKATRSNVIDPNAVEMVAAGSAHFPAFPAYRREVVGSLTLQLEERFKRIPVKTPIRATVGDLIEILALCPTESGKETGIWREDRLIPMLRFVQERLKSDEARVVIFRDRNLNKKEGGLRAVAGPGYKEYLDKDRPTLLLYQQNGHGWDEVPFWIPVLAFPKGNYAFIFTLE